MNILVAVDQPLSPEKLLDKVAGLAKAGDKVTILSIAELFPDVDELYSDTSIKEKLADRARQAAEDARAKLAARSIPAEAVVEAGTSPADAIISKAEAIGADLIVTGYRTKTGLDRFLIGSTAAKIARHAPCSVLVVR